MKTPLRINPNDTPASRAKNRQDWIDIAGRVLNGEFHGSDSSMVESLSMGLEAHGTAECKRAVALLKRGKDKR